MSRTRIDTVTGTTGTDSTYKQTTGTDIGNKRALDVTPQSVGPSELIINIDKTTTANTTYYGWAVPSTATSSAAWKIFRKVLTGADSAFTFADSDGSFDNIWDNRASLSYG